MASSAGSAPSNAEAVDREGERKQLTVLFADVQGSMDLQEGLDPEVWAGIMRRFVQILAEGVRKFGGTVDTFTGDGIMALFGAPVAQEDHARRACHAAWHLTKAIAAYAEELRRTQLVDLHVRPGLNSGEVVVGQVGEEVRLDPTALGHTVGLAQRMEALAEPGRAYLTEHTARLVEGWFRLGDLGPMTIKGAREPLRVYALEAPAPPRSASRAGRAFGASPLVGRDRELAILEDALAAATEGQAQVVGVVGEAGVGKSRLCEEFARSAVERGITVRRTTGVSHGRDVPLLPILAFLRGYFGISEADEPAWAREKVTVRVLDLDPDAEDALPLLFDFLEVSDPARPAPQLAPDVRMRRIFELLRRLTLRRSEREVLVLVVEDLHWFDPQSEAFLERLIESFPGSRTLVVTNFRPDFSARWMRHSYCRQLPLAPLLGAAVGELLVGFLGIDLSLTPLLGFVQERTGGNPFFVEEVVRVLVEDGTLAGSVGSYRLTRPLHEVKVPPSVHAVLAARIDRLPTEHKRVLQSAAVIGRTFPQPVLARVTGMAVEELEDILDALCAAELLQEAGRHPVTQFRFWHPLTQEVAYGTLLAGRRAHLHAAVAEALIEHAGDRLDELAAVLAWHWERAGRRLEAARWSVRAGAFALRSDLAEAKRRWRAAADLLRDVEDSPASLELGVETRIRLLQWGARTGMDRAEADRLETEGRALAERLGERRRIAHMVLTSGSPRVLSGDLKGGLARYLEAASLGSDDPDPDFRAIASMPPALALTFTGPLGEGLMWADRCLTVCADNPGRGAAYYGYSALARALQIRAGLLLRMGRLSEVAADLDRSLALARARAESDPLGWALALVPLLARLRGDGGDISASADEAVHIAEESGNLATLVMALEALCLTHLMAGRPVEAAGACERALDVARSKRSGLFAEASVLAHFALARLANGDHGPAAHAAVEAVEVARRQEARVYECLALLTRAQVGRLSGGSTKAVTADLDDALTLAGEVGALTYEPFIREELGRLLADESKLREACRLYEAIGATGHARRLVTELDGSPQGTPAPQRGG